MAWFFGGKSDIREDVSPAAAKTIPVIPHILAGDRERYDRLRSWLRENEAALAERTLADDDWLSDHALAVYPATPGGCFAYGPGCFPGIRPEEPVYVLADIHGDFDSFLAILSTILDLAGTEGVTNPAVLLLGDIIDRNGEGSAPVCALILAILQRRLPPEFGELCRIQLGIVKGDHDIGLLYDGPYSPEKRFSAAVIPADFSEWLNRRLDDGEGERAATIGLAWIRLMRECPAAALLEQIPAGGGAEIPCGTLLAHGGVPRKDLQKRFAAGEPYLMQSEAFATDFEWCRMTDSRRKLLNRFSRTSEIGGDEFDSFCRMVFPGPDAEHPSRVARFLFGHQHPAGGFEQYVRWYGGYQVASFSSFRADDALRGQTLPHFCRVSAESVEAHSVLLEFPDDTSEPEPESVPEVSAPETQAGDRLATNDNAL